MRQYLTWASAAADEVGGRETTLRWFQLAKGLTWAWTREEQV